MTRRRISGIRGTGAAVTVRLRLFAMSALAIAIMGLTANGEASTPRSQSSLVSVDVGTKAKAKAKTKAKTKSKKDKTAKSAPAPKAAAIPNPKGKVAVLAFDGDGATPLRARLVHLLRAKGLKVVTSLRPVDTPEQYREMADTLVLAAFLDGEASEDGDQASVTVHVRSGVSGLRVASATLAGERRKLGAAIDKELWTQLGPSLARVCADAAKPRKREREPMRIEAGTPLDSPAGPPKGT